MINHTFKLLFLISLFFIACKENAPISIYASCCSTNAIDAQIGTGKLYVPNVITPNSDGINDFLHPFGSDEISIINKFEIKSGNTVLFLQENFPVNDREYGWDGTFNGSVIKGVFSMIVTATDVAGTERTLTGEVCTLLCDDPEVGISLNNFFNCKHGTQHDGEGGHDNTLPGFEQNICLE